MEFGSYHTAALPLQLKDTWDSLMWRPRVQSGSHAMEGGVVQRNGRLAFLPCHCPGLRVKAPLCSALGGWSRMASFRGLERKLL